MHRRMDKNVICKMEFYASSLIMVELTACNQLGESYKHNIERKWPITKSHMNDYIYLSQEKRPICRA